MGHHDAMSQGTVPYHNNLIIAFDFDETLGPPTTPQLLGHCGFDADRFNKEEVLPLIEEHAWEKPLASTYALVQALKREGRTVTEADLEAWGARCPLYTGVEEMFDRLRGLAADILEDINVEFHMISAGFAEMIQACAIAHEFDNIWGGAFHFDEAGRLDTAKRVLTHAEKPRYLLQIAKDLPLDEANPNQAFHPLEKSQWKAPLDQFIFAGDGSSDLPAFEFLQKNGGIAIAVHHSDSAEKWEQADNTYDDRKVDNVAAADYSEGSEMLESLEQAVKAIAHRMRLRQLGIGQ